MLVHHLLCAGRTNPALHRINKDLKDLIASTKPLSHPDSEHLASGLQTLQTQTPKQLVQLRCPPARRSQGWARKEKQLQQENLLQFAQGRGLVPAPDAVLLQLVFGTRALGETKCSAELRQDVKMKCNQVKHDNLNKLAARNNTLYLLLYIDNMYI